MSAEQIVSKRAEGIIKQIQALLKENEQVMVAIEGRCASGKTTLASYLREKLSCEVIHMDDFFLRPEQRTMERLKEPGGNIDYERFLDEVLIPLEKSGETSYRPYDCTSRELKEAIVIKKNPVILIEGSYSAHPKFFEYYDLCYFLDVEKSLQIERIRKRNGEDKLQDFLNRWIPMEEMYFEKYRIKEKCSGLQF